jgi:uncharacterized LabA/DUF88 family protein
MCEVVREGGDDLSGCIRADKLIRAKARSPRAGIHVRRSADCVDGLPVYGLHTREFHPDPGIVCRPTSRCRGRVLEWLTSHWVRAMVRDNPSRLHIAPASSRGDLRKSKKQKRLRDFSRGRRTSAANAGAVTTPEYKIDRTKSQTKKKRQRVIAYIDGFNLYFGLREARWKRFYWLNVQTLVRHLLKANQELVFTKYFTSRVSEPPEKERRQSIFLEALETLSQFRIYYGHYQTNLQRCRKCANEVMIPSEKMTDVNIAVEILSDAYQDKFDVALLVSADSDLTAPVLAIKDLFPKKRIIVAFPPHRHSAHLQRLAHGSLKIGRASLAKSVFPDRVPKAGGFVLRKPDEWK